MNLEYYYFGLYENRYLNKKINIIKQTNEKTDIFEDDFQCLLLIKKIDEITYDIEKIIYSNLDDKDQVDNCFLKIQNIDDKIYYEFQHKKYNYSKKFSYGIFLIEKEKINYIYNKRLNERIIESYKFLRLYNDNPNYINLSNKIKDIFEENNLFID